MSANLFSRTLLFFALMAAPIMLEAKEWSLQDCLNYALQHNIALQKTQIAKQNAIEEARQSHAELFPSLNFTTSQNATYRPLPDRGSSMVSNGYVQSGVDKVYYNGTYSLNAAWVLWNGNQNTNNVKLHRLNIEKASLDSAETALKLAEQITQLYYQILYSSEALLVNRQTAQTSHQTELRGQEFYRVGKMSKAALAQLTAQTAQDEYGVVEAESAVKNFKRQLKQLLQITDDEPFDVLAPAASDEEALHALPSAVSVYEQALRHRPEIAGAQTNLRISDLHLKLARAKRMPTVSLNAGFSTNTTSMGNVKWTSQLQNNLYLGGGFTVSVPIADGRQARTAINKAFLEQQDNRLELRNKQTALYAAIEDFWLQATTNQSKFKAAKISVQSSEAGYELLSEQFRMGLKNIVELMKGKDQLLRAKQNELQSKYLAILNAQLLQLYAKP